MPDQDEALLREIRENYDYAKAEWADVYKERREDIRLIAGDAWPDEEKRERKASGRLCLTFDEVGQYENQTINEVRQNKRAVKVTPEGDGADDTTSYMRSGIIKGIEYKCDAANSYMVAFENVIQGSFGFWKLKIDYESAKSNHRVLKVVSVPNPETIYVDPLMKEPDGEDMGFAYELDTTTERAFKNRFRDAEIHSFSPDHEKAAPGWITSSDAGRRVQVAGYWKRKVTPRKRLTFGTGKSMFLDEIKGGKLKTARGNEAQLLVGGEVIPVLDWRVVDDVDVCQYVTNGLEILEENAVPWKSIPIIVLLGKRLYVSSGEGSEAKLVIQSLTRAARAPALGYSYARTAQIEMIGMSSKSGYEGYEGQFATGTKWSELYKKLVPFIEFKATTPQTQDAILPLPKRSSWEAPIQSAELVAVAMKQAVQSAMGIMGQLTGRRGQSLEAKSGLALEKLDAMESQSTFHYVDALDRGIKRTGRMMDEVLDVVYDLPRDVGMIRKNDEPAMISINKPGVHPDTQEPMEFSTATGSHGVTISTGPSSDSLRQDQSDFADHLVANAAIVDPGKREKVLALAVKLKNLGSIGDEIADILDPQQQNGKITPEQFQQVQQQGQIAMDIAHKLKAELDSKQPEIDAKLYIAAEDQKTRRLDILSKTAVQIAVTELEQSLGIVHKAVDQAHEVRLEQMDQGHEAAKLGATQAHDAAKTGATQAHASEMADKGHQQALEQNQQAADLQPEPEGEAAQ